MARTGRYYLGRVNMLGRLDKESLVEAIKSPATIHVGRFGWTITEVVLGEDDGIRRYTKICLWSIE